jgi:hypothetical protein
VNSTSSKSAKEPNAANRPTWAFDQIPCATANTLGMTMAARTERFTTSSSGSFVLSHRRAGDDGASGWCAGAAESLIGPALIITERDHSGKPSKWART